MRKPHDPAPVLGDLDGHPFAHTAKAIQRMLRQKGHVLGKGTIHLNSSKRYFIAEIPVEYIYS